jgi:hypothetical protein
LPPCDDCFNCCRGWHFVATGGIYVLQPFFDNDPAFTMSIYKGAGDPGTNVQPATTDSTTTTTSNSTQTTITDTGGPDKGVPPGLQKPHNHVWAGGLPPGLLKHAQPSTQTNTSNFTQTTTSVTTTQTPADPKPSASIDGATQLAHPDFAHHMEVAPLIWIGVANDDGLGVRGRWWQLSDSSGASIVNRDTSGSTVITSASPLGLSISSPGNTLSSGSGADLLNFHRDLDLVVWDLEATQSLEVGRCGVLLSGGVRYAHLGQSYAAARSNSDPGPATDGVIRQDTSILLSGHNFNGAGPMASIEVWCPIGESGLSLFGNVRGSVLFGARKEHASTQTVLAGTMADNTPFNQTSTENATADGDAVLPVVELEIGLEYGRQLGRFFPFVRTGLVGQNWFGAGNSSSTDGDLGFFGLEASLGVNF